MKLKSLFGIFAPPVCAVCGAPLVGAEACICTACEMELERPRIWEAGRGALWQRVARFRAPIRGVAAWTDYSRDSEAGRLIREGKYGGMPAIIRGLGHIEGRRLRTLGCCPELDVLLPVPMYWLKRLRRGYNQAEILARAIGEELDVPVGDNLVAVRSHGPRARQGATERLDRTHTNALRLRHGGELTGLDIAVVDDIITTGATLSEAVDAVMEAEPRSVTLITLAATVHL